MSSFNVNATSLQAVRKTLEGLAANLRGLQTSTASFDWEVLGGGRLPGELTLFNDNWQHAVNIVSGEITSLSTALAQAIRAYEQIDGTIASKAKASGGGTTPRSGGHTGNGSGGSGKGPASGAGKGKKSEPVLGTGVATAGLGGLAGVGDAGAIDITGGSGTTVEDTTTPPAPPIEPIYLAE